MFAALFILPNRFLYIIKIGIPRELYRLLAVSYYLLLAIMTHKHNAQGKVDRSKSTLSLPKLSRPSIEDITLDKDKMQARLKELSISTLRKAKLHYPSFT